MQVYRNNVFESLVGALKAVYPAVERLVGAGFFAYAADGYIRRHPPASGNLHDFGGDFAGFLTGFEPARELAYLPDVARLEWAWHRAFHAADQAPLALARLAAVPPEQYGKLRFRLHPSVQLIASDYPILRIWQVNQPEYAGNVVVNLADGGVRLLVARRELEVVIESLSAGDDALLRAFVAGRRLRRRAPWRSRRSRTTTWPRHCAGMSRAPSLPMCRRHKCRARQGRRERPIFQLQETGHDPR